jgi:hypothetical protein
VASGTERPDHQGRGSRERPLPVAPAVERAASEGGDPACRLERVCPECGRITDGAPPVVCGRCGTLVEG